MKPYSIVVTTYQHRFDTFLKPIITQIKTFRSDIEVFITINGETNKPFDQQYRRAILQFIAHQPNCFVIMYPEFRSLSKMWNEGLAHSSNHYNLVLNDDLLIQSPAFFDSLEGYLGSEEYDRKLNKNFKINGSWSHVFLDRRQIDEMGWFDERMLGIGIEDGVMSWEMKKKFGDFIPNVSFPAITNVISHADCTIGQRKYAGKYSQFNEDFFLERFEYVPANEGIPAEWCKDNALKDNMPKPNQCPSERYFWENKSKL